MNVFSRGGFKSCSSAVADTRLACFPPFLMFLFSSGPGVSPGWGASVRFMVHGRERFEEAVFRYVDEESVWNGRGSLSEGFLDERNCIEKRQRLTLLTLVLKKPVIVS